MTERNTFYYEKGYAMDVGDSAKRLIEARDAYIEAWIEWNETCLGGLMDANDEGEVICNILNKIIKKQREETQEKTE